MKRARIIAAVIWLVLSAWLLVWVLEKLLRADQRGSALPLRDDTDLIAPLLIGVAWGFASMMVGVLARTARRSRAHDITAMLAATGQVIEVHDSGLSHERVEGHPLKIWHLIVRVDPSGEEPFLGALSTDDGAVEVGEQALVRYRPQNPDVLYADHEVSAR